MNETSTHGIQTILTSHQFHCFLKESTTIDNIVEPEIGVLCTTLKLPDINEESIMEIIRSPKIVDSPTSSINPNKYENSNSSSAKGFPLKNVKTKPQMRSFQLDIRRFIQNKRGTPKCDNYHTNQLSVKTKRCGVEHKVPVVDLKLKFCR